MKKREHKRNGLKEREPKLLDAVGMGEQPLIVMGKKSVEGGITIFKYGWKSPKTGDWHYFYDTGALCKENTKRHHEAQAQYREEGLPYFGMDNYKSMAGKFIWREGIAVAYVVGDIEKYGIKDYGFRGIYFPNGLDVGLLPIIAEAYKSRTTAARYRIYYPTVEEQKRAMQCMRAAMGRKMKVNSKCGKLERQISRAFAKAGIIHWRIEKEGGGFSVIVIGSKPRDWEERYYFSQPDTIEDEEVDEEMENLLWYWRALQKVHTDIDIIIEKHKRITTKYGLDRTVRIR